MGSSWWLHPVLMEAGPLCAPRAELTWDTTSISPGSCSCAYLAEPPLVLPFFFFFLIPAFNKRPEACVPCLEQSVPTQHLTATRSFQQVQNPGGMQPPGGWGRGSRGCCCFFRGEQPHGCTVSICLSRFRWDGASRAPLASAVTSVCAIK